MDMAKRVAILLENGVDPAGERHTTASLARAAEISGQGLLNLLNGSTQSPSLQTARALCRVYGLSIDYFDLPSAEACRTYLLQAQAQHQPLLQTISQHAAQLSADDRRSISSIIRWIQAQDAARDAR